MRRIATILLMAMICLISCGDNVAEYIYPYVEFEETEDGTAGVRLLKAIDDLGELPDKAVVNGSSLDVDTFLGYSEKAASDARKLTLSSNIRKIGRNALSNTSLEELVIEGDVDISEVELPSSIKAISTSGDTWAQMPEMEENNGYAFLGWYYDGDDGSRVKAEAGSSKPAGAVSYPLWNGGLSLSGMSYLDDTEGEVDKLELAIRDSDGNAVGSTITISKAEDGTFSSDSVILEPGKYTVEVIPYSGSTKLDTKLREIEIESAKECGDLSGSDMSETMTGTLALGSISLPPSTGDIALTITRDSDGKVIDDTIKLTADNSYSYEKELPIGDYTLVFTGDDGTTATKSCQIADGKTFTLSGDVSNGYTTDESGNYVLTRADGEALQSAIAEAGKAGGNATIRLEDGLGTIVLDSTLSIDDGNITLDLNGNTLEGNISTSSTLAITDSSSTKNGAISGTIAVSDGTLTLDGVAISSTSSPAISIGQGATASINGGSVSGTGSGIETSGTLSIGDGASIKTTGKAIVVNDGTTTIADGAIESSTAAIVVNGGSASVEGGSVASSGDSTITINDGSLAINGGTVSNTGTSYDATAIDSNGGTTTISGGTIESDRFSIDNIGNVSEAVTITGGTISGKSDYKVAYDANGASGTMGESVKYKGINAGLSDNGYTYDGYNFKGWNTKADGSGTSYSADSEYEGNQSITLYAIWGEIEITYKANGGSGSDFTKTKATGASYTIEDSSDSKFMYWNTKADNTGTRYYVGDSYQEDSDLTLYAQTNTSSSYTLSYTGNNGPVSVNVSPNNTITEGRNVYDSFYFNSNYAMKSSWCRLVEWNPSSSAMVEIGGPSGYFVGIIGANAFKNRKDISYVIIAGADDIPNMLYKIEQGAFYGCSSNLQIIMGGTIDEWNSYIPGGIYNILTFPVGVTLLLTDSGSSQYYTMNSSGEFVLKNT